MERSDRAPLIGAFAAAAIGGPGVVELDEDTAHHLRVRRAAPGDAVRVTDGFGARGTGVLTTLGKRSAAVELSAVARVPAPPPFSLAVPIADRDRMLLAAEKAVEIGVRAWLPVRWRRSRSVAPRGEGPAFDAKVRARMIAALVQSDGAWLPAIEEERDVATLAAPDAATSLLLDAAGRPLLAVAPPADRAVLVAVGPEGGVEPDERAALLARGFVAASLGPRVLRFETAALVALGVLHAARAARTAGDAAAPASP